MPRIVPVPVLIYFIESSKQLWKVGEILCAGGNRCRDDIAFSKVTWLRNDKRKIRTETWPIPAKQKPHDSIYLKAECHWGSSKLKTPPLNTHTKNPAARSCPRPSQPWFSAFCPQMELTVLKSCVNNNTNSIKPSLFPFRSPPAPIVVLLVANMYLMRVGMGGETILKTKQNVIQKADLYGEKERKNTNAEYKSVKWGWAVYVQNAVARPLTLHFHHPMFQSPTHWTMNFAGRGSTPLISTS